MGEHAINKQIQAVLLFNPCNTTDTLPSWTQRAGVSEKLHDVAAGVTGAIVRDPVQDAAVWRENLETVVEGATAGMISSKPVVRRPGSRRALDLESR